MNHIKPSLKPRRRLFSRALPISIGGLLAATALTSFGQDAGRMDKLESENKALKQRLDSLEALARKEGLVPSGDAPHALSALSESTISGFVTASYFYNTSDPADRLSDGYLWNTRDNQFSVNKVKVTLASPAVGRSGEKWDAGYRVSLVWGDDAWAVDTGLGRAGFDQIREAFIDLNVPIGSGLNVKAGHLISLLNYESGDGGAANNNFSQGFQWYYTGNGPGTGAQLGYTFTDWLSANLRVQNSMFSGPIENTDSKTVIGSLNFKPTKDLWFNLIGFGGGDITPGGARYELLGGSVLAGYQVTAEFNAGLEFDYFHYDFGAGTDPYIWSIGTFLSYDFTPKVGLGLRAEYLDDHGGNLKAIGHLANGPTLPPGSANSNIGFGSPDPSGDLASVTLTLNYKPTPNIRIQPEVRYDTTSYSNGLDGETSRVIVGAGITYSF
jgi:hypothetical protein